MFFGNQLMAELNSLTGSSEEIAKIIKIVCKKEREYNESHILDDYLYYFGKKHAYPNGLIILDASIDRRYKVVMMMAVEQGFDLFIINIRLPKKSITERIKKRNKENAYDYFKEMNRWQKEHKIFEENVDFDIIIMKDNSDLTLLFSKLDKILYK